MSTSYPTTPGQQMGGGPLPQKGEPVPPPYNNQLPGGVPPQPGYVPAQQPPQQYGGQYNQGYQPGPQPVMAGPPVQQYAQPQQPPQVTVQAVTVVAPTQQGSSNVWHQSFCGCFDSFMICLATFCCPECVFFCISYYGKLLKYFIMSYVCVGISAFFYLIYYMVYAM
ncbi:uncharacterized protein LOC142341342 [Convolutriloba macropyga]|uniref:uncharacterized protein LOC142341342 n=1 Tax=Convolutriloba macropyga TaxID=536237 RepID=UPI003F5212EE